RDRRHWMAERAPRHGDSGEGSDQGVESVRASGDGRLELAERNPLRDPGEDRHPRGDRGWPISVILGEGQSPALELCSGERLDQETGGRMSPRPDRAARLGEET